MPPSYSVRRGRLTAQLLCRTGTSYTPEMCKTRRRAPQLSTHFYLLLSILGGDIENIGDIDDRRAKEQNFLALK